MCWYRYDRKFKSAEVDFRWYYIQSCTILHELQRTPQTAEFVLTRLRSEKGLCTSLPKHEVGDD
jgi:hypothetical protein